MGDIRVIDNSDLIEYIKPIRKLANSRGYTYGWHSNKNMRYMHWNVKFVSGRKHMRYDLQNSLPEEAKQLFDYGREKYFPAHKHVLRAYCNSYTYGTEGYIHTDSLDLTDMTIIFYMCDEWDPNWAGETAFVENGDVVKSVMPKPGRAVIFPSHMLHVGRSVSRECVNIRDIFVLKVALENNAVAIKDLKSRFFLNTFLKSAKADEMGHTGRSLLEHLISTRDLLEFKNMPKYVCDAGGLHSIYGTNIYKKSTINPMQRDLIRKAFGEKTEELVYLFSTIDRPRCLEEGSIEVDEETLYNLRMIEAANLIEQNKGTINKYPKIYNIWQTKK